MQRKNYTRPLTADDRIHVSFSKHRGVILTFSVNYAARIDGRWREIFRVDNCHGTPHIHRYYLRRKQFKLSLSDSNNQAFTLAYTYVVTNFQAIRENYLRVRPRT